MRAQEPWAELPSTDEQRRISPDDVDGEEPAGALRRLVAAIILGIMVLFAIIAVAVALV